MQSGEPARDRDPAGSDEKTYQNYIFSSEKMCQEYTFSPIRPVLPLEVKAEENLRSKSARVYYDKFHPAYVIRTSMVGAVDQDWIRKIPLWAIQSI